MSAVFTDAVGAVAAFAAETAISDRARQRAPTAFVDTCGVMLAGSGEAAARIAQSLASEEGAGECRVAGTSITTGAALAAFANGVAAHALDYDDMCFVSLAHPSAPLVPALLAAGELSGASGSAILDAYVMGFEVEARLGRVMNPRHYQRGWHCTSTLGAIGAHPASGLPIDTAQLHPISEYTRAVARIGVRRMMVCVIVPNPPSHVLTFDPPGATVFDRSVSVTSPVRLT